MRKIINIKFYSKNHSGIFFYGLVIYTFSQVNLENEEIMLKLLGEEIKTIDRYIQGGIKQDSLLINFCIKHWPENYHKYGKIILKRISSAKFRKSYNQKMAISLPPVSSTPPTDQIHSEKDSEKDEPKNKSLEKRKIGSFELQKCEIIDGNRFKESGRAWTQSIYDYIGSINECSIQIKKKSAAPLYNKFKINAYCRFPDCNAHYYIECSNIKTEILTLNVFSDSVINSEAHDHRKLRNVSGAKRQKIAIETVQFGPKFVSTKQITTQDLSKANFASESVCQTLGALRQLKYEKMAFSDFDKDDRIDVLFLKNLTDNEPPSQTNLTPSFIRYIRADELAVFCMCRTQIDCFLQNKRREIYLDATGNLTKSKYSEKRQFYYALVYRSELSNEIVPLAEFISSSHDVENLTTLLTICSRELKTSTSRSMDLITVDFSFALMNAATLAFNQCNLFNYLQLIHQKFIKGDLDMLKVTIICSCSVHVIKFFSDKLNICDKNTRELFMQTFARLITAESYPEFLDLSASFYISMSSKTVSIDILSRLLPNSASRQVLSNFSESNDIESNPETKVAGEMVSNSSLYSKTNFASDIYQKIDELNHSIVNNKISSNYFNEELAEYFLKHLAPFGPLWSSFLHKRGSNAAVESHFKVCKKDIVKTVNAKPSRVIKELRVFTLSKLIPIFTNKAYKKKLKQKSCQNEPEESFKKVKMPQITNFEKIKQSENRTCSDSQITRIRRPFFPNSLSKKIDEQTLLIKNTQFDEDFKYDYFQRIINGIKLVKSDIQSTDNKEWLNDNIIDSNICLVANENANLGYINCISSARISESKHDQIFSCAESKMWSFLKNAKTVFIPMNIRGIHWSLAVFNIGNLIYFLHIKKFH